jgi:predicted transcriptional regulator
MIDFACKEFSLEEVIKCGLGLSKGDFIVFSFLMKNHDKLFTTGEIEAKLDLDLTSVQRGVKKLHGAGILERQQVNLSGGGYAFKYKLKSKKEVERIVLAVIDNWVDTVKKEFRRW